MELLSILWFTCHKVLRLWALFVTHDKTHKRQEAFYQAS